MGIDSGVLASDSLGAFSLPRVDGAKRLTCSALPAYQSIPKANVGSTLQGTAEAQIRHQPTGPISSELLGERSAPLSFLELLRDPLVLAVAAVPAATR